MSSWLPLGPLPWDPSHHVVRTLKLYRGVERPHDEELSSLVTLVLTGQWTFPRHQGKPWPRPTAGAPLLVQLVKNLPAMQGTQVGFLCLIPEKKMATHASILAWKIPGTQ